MGSPRGEKRWYEGHCHETKRREPHATGEHTTATEHANHKPEGAKRARVVCSRAQTNTSRVCRGSMNPSPPPQTPRGWKDRGWTTRTKYTHNAATSAHLLTK